jgi:ABC-type hemin transport system substrate-binding protein
VKLIGCVLFVLFCSSCSSESEPQVSGARIVSLSPSITTSLIEMGVGQHIVGRSAFCEKGDTSIPVVGDLYAVDYERLLRLQPTHVFVQPQATGVDSHLQELAENGEFILRSWNLNGIKDIQALALDLAELLDVSELTVSPNMNGNAVSTATTLLMTIGSEQQVGICFGKNTYLDDIWSAMGGVNALQKDGWQKLSLEDIARLSPSRIVIVNDVLFTQKSPLDSLDIPVIKFVHKDVLIPSIRVAKVAKSLADCLAESK